MTPNKGTRNTAGLGLADVPSKQQRKLELFRAAGVTLSAASYRKVRAPKGSQLLASRAVQPAPVVVVFLNGYCTKLLL